MAKLISINSKTDETVIVISRKELSSIMGRDICYTHEWDLVTSESLTKAINIFSVNKTCINDLNYKAKSIKNDLLKMIDSINSVDFILPKQESKE